MSALPPLPDEERLRRFDLARRVAARIPFGWRGGRLVTTRGGNLEQEVIQWTCDVANALGVDDEGLRVATIQSIESRY